MKFIFSILVALMLLLVACKKDPLPPKTNQLPSSILLAGDSAGLTIIPFNFIYRWGQGFDCDLNNDGEVDLRIEDRITHGQTLNWDHWRIQALNKNTKVANKMQLFYQIEDIYPPSYNQTDTIMFTRRFWSIEKNNRYIDSKTINIAFPFIAGDSIQTYTEWSDTVLTLYDDNGIYYSYGMKTRPHYIENLTTDQTITISHSQKFYIGFRFSGNLLNTYG